MLSANFALALVRQMSDNSVMAKTKRLTMRVSAALFHALLEDADNQGVTYSAVARGILNRNYFSLRSRRVTKPYKLRPKIRHI